MPYPPNGPGFTPYAYYLNYGRWPGPDAQISTPLVYDDCLTVEQQFASWWADQRDQTGALKQYTDDKVAEEAQIRKNEDERVLKEAKDYADGKAADLQAQLNAEVARAKAEESRIESESKTRDSAEQNRAEAAEAKLTQDLATEAARAKDAEEQLQDNLDAETEQRKAADSANNKKIDAEITRAKKAEADIEAHLDTVEDELQAADAAEQADRIAADKKLYDIVVAALKSAYLDETGTMHFSIEQWQ